MDRIVKLLENVLLLFLAIVLIPSFFVIFYISFCLMGGFGTELPILLTVLLIVVSCVSTYILVRLGWVDKGDWTRKIFLWIACFSLAGIPLSVVVGLYSVYTMGTMTKIQVLLVVLFIIWSLTSLCVAVKLDLFGAGEPVSEGVRLFFIFFFPIIFIWGLWLFRGGALWNNDTGYGINTPTFLSLVGTSIPPLAKPNSLNRATMGGNELVLATRGSWLSHLFIKCWHGTQVKSGVDWQHSPISKLHFSWHVSIGDLLRQL